MSNIKIGRAGEDATAKMYEALGYSVFKRNYYSKDGEIDLILKKDDLLVFCEVKTRSGTEFGTGFDAITKWKKQAMIKTASRFLQEISDEMAVRFDAVWVIVGKKQGEVFVKDISLIENAFEVSDEIF